MLAVATAEVQDEGRAPGVSVCESRPAATAADHTARGTRCGGAGSSQQDMPCPPVRHTAKSIISCNCYFDGSFVIVQRDGGLCQPWQVPI